MSKTDKNLENRTVLVVYPRLDIYAYLLMTSLQGSIYASVKSKVMVSHRHTHTEDPAECGGGAQ